MTLDVHLANHIAQRLQTVHQSDNLGFFLSGGYVLACSLTANLYCLLYISSSP
jgi:hypothetical protein